MRVPAGLSQHLKRLIRRIRQLGQPERYRPEKHYLRGSGPKSRAKSASEMRGISSDQP